VLDSKAQKLAALTDEDLEDLDLNAVSTISLCLVNEIFYNILGKYSTGNFLEKLKSLYTTKSLTKHLLLKQNYENCH